MRKITRRGFVAALIGTLGVTTALWADEHGVINFVSPGSVTPGASMSVQVTVSQVPATVVFTSAPAGLVSHAATITQTTQTVSVPTFSGASPGTYVVTAAPASGGAGRARLVTAGGGN